MSESQNSYVAVLRGLGVNPGTAKELLTQIRLSPSDDVDTESTQPNKMPEKVINEVGVGAGMQRDQQHEARSIRFTPNK